MPAADLTELAPWWTPWPGVGPGHDLLGDLTGRHVVELGCGRGDNAAAFAATAATVTAVDHDPAKITDATRRWTGVPRLCFVDADAAEYLTTSDQRPDVVCSIFGALSFTDPGLIDQIVRRLHPTGTLAISARLDGTRSADDWANLLAAHDLTVVNWLEITHPTDPAQAPCLVATARRTARVSARVSVAHSWHKMGKRRVVVVFGHNCGGCVVGLAWT